VGRSRIDGSGAGAMLVFVENSNKVIQECNYQEKIALLNEHYIPLGPIDPLPLLTYCFLREPLTAGTTCQFC
jgi:hypothetical protein